jgi:hypothetical protein
MDMQYGTKINQLDSSRHLEANSNYNYQVNLYIEIDQAFVEKSGGSMTTAIKDKWKSISTRAAVWLNCLKNAHLPSKFSWVSYRLQLWSSVRYWLGTLPAPLATFAELTANFAYQALPYLGVNQNIRAEWRYLHNTFGGIGLWDLSTEAVICRVNLLVQHWGMISPIGSMLQTSMEYPHLEVGCLNCPLSMKYDPMGPLATHCWLCSFWECISKYDICLEIDYPSLKLPHENHLGTIC